MAIQITNSFEGTNIVRNLSLLKRSLDATSRKNVSQPATEPAAPTAVETVPSEQMRTQIGTLSEKVKNLESTANCGSIAIEGLKQLLSVAKEVRQIVQAAAKEEGYTKASGEAHQSEIDKLLESYNHLLEGISYKGEKLLDGSPASLAKIEKLETLEVDHPEKAQLTGKKVESLMNSIALAINVVVSRTNSEYDETISFLRASESSPDDPGQHEKEGISFQSHSLRENIQSNGDLATLAQGNLVPESVFRLMQV